MVATPRAMVSMDLTVGLTGCWIRPLSALRPMVARPCALTTLSACKLLRLRKGTRYLFVIFTRPLHIDFTRGWQHRLIHRRIIDDHARSPYAKPSESEDKPTGP